MKKEICPWATRTGNPLYLSYHNSEWGVPVTDDKKLFEFLLLEGAQAGLSWETILNRRENYKIAFSGFDFNKVAGFGKGDVERLMKNPGIIRNRLKINSAVSNAKVFLKIREEFGTFSKYFWGFSGGKRIVNRFRSLKEIPAKTPLSEKLSKDLKKRGMNFVGQTIMYAYVQAVGMANDHLVSCPKWKEIEREFAGRNFFDK